MQSRAFRDVLERKGLTYRQLGALAGITSLSTLSDLMYDDREIDIGFDIPDILAIGKILGADFWKAAQINCPRCGSNDLKAGTTQEEHLRTGEAVRKARTQKGWTLAKLSDEIGYFENFLMETEAGKPISGARLGGMRLMASALDLPIAVILTLTCLDCRYPDDQDAL